MDVSFIKKLTLMSDDKFYLSLTRSIHARKIDFLYFSRNISNYIHNVTKEKEEKKFLSQTERHGTDMELG